MMTKTILSVVMTISMMYGFLTIIKLWVPTICSNDTFIKIGATVLILDVLLILLWYLVRSINDDDDFRKGKYTN